MRLTIPILIACLLPSSAGAAGKQARKKEIQALRQELRHLDLLAREELAPHDPSPEAYHHDRTGEDNGDAHCKRQVMGREVVVAVTEGRLDFGIWERIFYGEFDGRPPKRVLIKIIGD